MKKIEEMTLSELHELCQVLDWMRARMCAEMRDYITSSGDMNMTRASASDKDKQRKVSLINELIIKITNRMEHLVFNEIS